MNSTRSHPLASGYAPAWAWGWGQDRFGVFTEIKIGDVVQRMRWIFPGSFPMGSPESEKRRSPWEGPQHEVTLTEGFWLADSPCTQALWQEVMGENPSRFRSPNRPVEGVNWEDCQRFLERANGRVASLEAKLPAEAQWEYACRAGTKTATWLGDLEIEGGRNAPLLDEIAWYGGNSGQGFDLADGHDVSDWNERQYQDPRAGTRIVKTKQPNPWGLYDMLGNVWEWCADHWEFGERYPDGPRIDPVGTSGPDRVIRGGSWDARARRVRAAYRYGLDPGNRDGRLGFRLSRGPGREPGPGR